MIGINKKYKIIAVDFDGTLCSFKYPDIGRPNMGLIRKLLKYQKQGSEIILWTCRTGDRLKEAIEWCKKYDLYFNYVNQNTDEILSLYDNKDSRKITADVYIDDKARRSI